MTGEKNPSDGQSKGGDLLDRKWAGSRVDRNKLEARLRRSFARAVEVESLDHRRNRIEQLYGEGMIQGITIDAMNCIYNSALSGMARNRTYDDDILSVVDTDENDKKHLYQIWPLPVLPVEQAN